MLLNIKKSNFHQCNPEKWNKLILESENSTFFQTYEWLDLWLKHFQNELDNIFVLEIYDHDRLVGIAPFAIKDNTIRILGTSHTYNNDSFSDYGDIIVKSGYEKQAWLKLIETLSELYSTSKLELLYLKENSLSTKVLTTTLYCNFSLINLAPIIVLPPTWDTFLNQLSSHHRHELKRKLKNVTSHHLELVTDAGVQSKDEFIRLAGLSKSEKAHFYTSSAGLFFEDILEDTRLKKYIHTFFLVREKRNIASCIIINFKNTWMGYNIAFDPAYQNLSPGIVLFGLIIQKAILAKKQCFDFLRGDEAYKYRFGANDQRLLKVEHDL